MKPELWNPITDSVRLAEASLLTAKVYHLHERGQDYSPVLTQLSQLTHREVSKFEADAAFGCIDSTTFARNLLIESSAIPPNLSDVELEELVESICNAVGDESQTAYWLKCLQVNTGEHRISDLIFWPGVYFADGNNQRKMSSRQIVEVALSRGSNRKADIRFIDVKERTACGRNLLREVFFT